MDSEVKRIANTIKLNDEGILNGLVFWQEITYDDEFVINSGIMEKPESKKAIKWSMKYKQGVHLLEKQYKIEKNNIDKININYSIDINLKNGIFDCRFQINE